MMRHTLYDEISILRIINTLTIIDAVDDRTTTEEFAAVIEERIVESLNSFIPQTG